MSKNSSEFLKHIPGFDLSAETGGMLVNKIDRKGVIGWEAYTSRELMGFELVEEGLRVTAQDLGLGIFYDSKGDLSAVRVDLVNFLYGLLEVYDDDSHDEESLGMFIDLATFLETSGHSYIAHIDVTNGGCCLYATENNSGEVKVLANESKINFTASPAVIMVSFEEMTFGLILHKMEDDFGVGIGTNEPSDEPSSVGTLPNGVEIDEPRADMLACLLATDCNYMTFLDGKSPDRFERLARRIIRD